MSLPITSLRPPVAIPAIEMPTGIPESAGKGANTFQSVFSDAIGHVEQLGQNANASVNRFLSGENEEIHHVALATQQSDLAFELFMQVRNKVVSAYQEVMRMQM